MRYTFMARSLAALGILLAAGASQAAGHGPHWEYAGHHGAAHWAELDASFETCASGHQQSPINIHHAVKTDLPKLDFHYSAAVPTIVNNGHTVQVNLPAGNTLAVGDQNFELLQFHFHTPSEETLNGKPKAMVAHFVHKNGAGKLGVVGLLIQPGKPNAALAPVFAHLPRSGESITVEDLSLNLADMLPKDLHYYAFDGSLTTPPCSEGVSWMVLKQPVTLGMDQIRAFRRLFPANARPVQKLHDRVVKESL